MKIGITAGFVAGTYLIATYFSGEPTPTSSPQVIPTLKALPRAQAAIVHFEFEPDPNRYEDQQLQLRIERRTDNKLYLVDASKPEQGRTSYYALNGSVNRVDARQLTQQPLLPNRWIHLVKYVTEVANVNSESWLTSAFNVAAGQAKYAAAYEAIFWVRDSLDTPPKKIAYTQPLWPNNDALGDSRIFKQTPAFTLLNKKYGSESLPIDEPIKNLQKVSWNVNPTKFKLMYAGEVDGLIKHIKPRNKQGVTRFDSKQLDQAADWLAKNTPADAFSVDFEPGKAEEGWHWDMSDPNFGKIMYELSDRIYKRHGKLFYSWIGDAPSFEFKGKTFTLDGYANDNWSAGKKNIDDYLSIHQEAKAIQNVKIPYPTILMTGFGYTSSTVNTSDATDQPPQVWKAPVNWYLRTLDVLNLKSLIVPQKVKFLNFLWPYEDKPSDARRSYTRRFRVGNGTKGYIRQLDNRVMYPMNLVRDAVFLHLCNPRVFYTNYWIFGQSYNPYQALRYSKINENLSCESQKTGGYFVYEYQGPDQPACPSLNEDYIGKDALGIATMVQAHELFAKYQHILDGTQTRESYGFEYQRGTQEAKTAVWQNDTGEFARAFKHNQPWIQVWKNPKTGKRLLLFQDNFAEAFEPVTFTTLINGKKIQRKAEGNMLYLEEL